MQLTRFILIAIYSGVTFPEPPHARLRPAHTHTPTKPEVEVTEYDLKRSVRKKQQQKILK